MRADARAALTPAQGAWLAAELGSWRLVADHSWPLQDTTVLRVADADGRDLVVRASETSRHIARELAAHERLGPRVADPGDPLHGRLPELVAGDVGAGVLVTRWLPGELAWGTPAALDPDVHRQAGRLLDALLEPAEPDPGYAARLRESALGRATQAEGLADPSHLAVARRLLTAADVPAVPLWWGHGDWQPRNWLVHDGEVRAIDLGRAAARPMLADLGRLRFDAFAARPELARAFAEGFGRTPTGDELAMERLEHVAESLGTIVWAHGIGDHDFEEHGRRMLARVVAEQG